MKKLLLMFLAAATLLGCSKNGEVGPKGDKGDQGEVGTKGETGIDGTVIHSGSTNPSLSTGKNGDYYINLTTGSLYGPKTSTSWGSPTSLKGDKGDSGNNGSNGSNGSKIYSGDDIPSKLLGIDGDFYFLKKDLAFYGPKTSNGWGNPIILGSTQKAGVQVFLIRNVKFTTPANTGLDYTGAQPYFYYKNNEVNLGDLNIKKGLYFMYWRYNRPGNDNNVTVNNYYTHTWNDLASNGVNENDTYGSYNVTMRLDPLRIGYNPITNNNVIQWLFVGKTWRNEFINGDPHEFKIFRENATFDILIKYIPEASVNVIGKNGNELSELLSIQSK